MNDPSTIKVLLTKQKASLFAFPFTDFNININTLINILTFFSSKYILKVLH